MTQSAPLPADAELEAYMDAAAALLGLPVAPDDRPGVLANLRVTARFAALVAEFPLDEREEPAPVFRP
jgi:hypothetical protein